MNEPRVNRTDGRFGAQAGVVVQSRYQLSVFGCVPNRVKAEAQRYLDCGVSHQRHRARYAEAMKTGLTSIMYADGEAAARSAFEMLKGTPKVRRYR